MKTEKRVDYKSECVLLTRGMNTEGKTFKYIWNLINLEKYSEVPIKWSEAHKIAVTKKLEEEKGRYE